MSNNDYQSSNTNGLTANAEVWGSFEDIHNSVHTQTGGTGGDMSDLDTSAFDPIFWLHHT